MNQLGKQLGENMIACVDSDYDYLLQGRTNTSRYIIENPYVMQKPMHTPLRTTIAMPKGCMKSASWLR